MCLEAERMISDTYSASGDGCGLVIYFRRSAIKALCYPGGRALARSIAQRTRKAAKDAA